MQWCRNDMRNRGEVQEKIKQLSETTLIEVSEYSL